MNRVEFLDTLAISFGGGRSWKTGFRLARDAIRLSRRAKNLHVDGYEFEGMCFETINPTHFGLLFSEIFVAEPYAFSASSPHPLIIDGGVNIGLSVAYFAKRYPSSRIIGFEPHPAAFEVASRNIRRNKMHNVDLKHAALTGQGQEVDLVFTADEIMASTVGPRLTVRNAETKVVRVPAVQLSKFLDEPVDFVKLDIEGAETSVLDECQAKLRAVKNMFIEFHVTRGDTTNRLSRCAEVLEGNGFDYLITSTLGMRRAAAVAPLRACGAVTSTIIHAQRVD